MERANAALEILGDQEVLALDEQWYNQFEALGSFQPFLLFEGDADYRQQQKEAFLSAEEGNPTLDYPKINTEDLKKREAELLKLKKDIISDPQTHEVVKWVYRWKINEKIAEFKLLQATAAGDMDRFKACSEFVYGRPSSEVFQHNISQIQEDISRALGSGNADLAEAAKNLSEALPITQVETSEDSVISLKPELPTEELRERVASHTRQKLAGLLGGEKYEALLQKINQEVDFKYSPEQVQEIFASVLERLKAEGWQAVLERGRKIFSVSQAKRQLNIPDRQDTAQRVSELIVHEVGIHLMRRLNGERSVLRLMALGLDRYVAGEEGLASTVEDSIKPELNDFFGPDRHLAISLAYGLDGTPRDFRGVFEIMQKYHYLKKLEAGMTPDQAKTAADNAAWMNCVRTFRGTDCKTPGVCYTKDMLYREGNIQTWRLLGNTPEDQFEMQMGMLEKGKFDQNNVRHIWVMLKLGILDEDLVEIFADKEDLRELDNQYLRAA